MNDLLGIVREPHALGLRRIGLAGTTGTAPPGHVASAVGRIREELPEVPLSLHLHDAHRQALSTVDAMLESGVTRFDTALGGYGGSPFAPGAHGRPATERFIAHLHGRGGWTGIDSDRFWAAKRLLESVLRASPKLRVA